MVAKTAVIRPCTLHVESCPPHLLADLSSMAPLCLNRPNELAFVHAAPASEFSRSIAGALCALFLRVHPDRGYFGELSVLELCRGRALPVLQP